MDKEGKMVTFNRQEYDAEQTPLMFSRCSSLGSLNGFEQRSNRSSIISDFSRRTSGIVSPSELPDSPTQTIPQSPRNHKNADLISKIPEEAVRSSIRHLSYTKCHHPTTSVFEDDIATFKEESTPIEFSTATSLSCLTIDDEMKSPSVSEPQKESKESETEVDKDIKADSSIEKVEVKDQTQANDEVDKDVLTECIGRGIQNYRYRQSFKTSIVQKPMQAESTNTLEHCQRAVSNRLEPSTLDPVTSVDSTMTASKQNKTMIEVTTAPDTMHVYCTEDTPADISPVGSLSNIALSMPSVQEDVEETKSPEESSKLSVEEEMILEECIQLGIERFRQRTSPSTSCILYSQKTELITQRFDLYDTPSPSPMENKGMLENERDLLYRTPNHSDDDTDPSESVKTMPKAMLKQATEKLERKLSTYHQTEHNHQSKHRLQKPVSFEDNSSLSEEEEEEEECMLAQCIKSGMAKALNVSSKTQTEYSKARNTSNYYVNKPYSAESELYVQERNRRHVNAYERSSPLTCARKFPEQNENILSPSPIEESPDEDSKLSAEEEKILEECIQLGITRTLQRQLRSQIKLR